MKHDAIFLPKLLTVSGAALPSASGFPSERESQNK